MTISSLTRADIRIRDWVSRQLEWDSEVEAGAIGVTAKDGVVALTGYVDTYAAKLAAERAAKRVRGVRAVANDVEVRPGLGRTDVDIAGDAASALKIRHAVPDSVQAVVHHGWVTLTGPVRWLYQRGEAEKAVRHVAGVRGIHNHITVVPGEAASDVRHRIAEALHRHADVDARGITVSVSADEVTLSGRVTSWAQRDAAERAAAHAPGIVRIHNEILVADDEPADEIC